MKFAPEKNNVKTRNHHWLVKDQSVNKQNVNTDL